MPDLQVVDQTLLKEWVANVKKERAGNSGGGENCCQIHPEEVGQAMTTHKCHMTFTDP